MIEALSRTSQVRRRDGVEALLGWAFLILVLGGLAACQPSAKPSQPAAGTKTTYDMLLNDSNAGIAAGEALVKDPIQSSQWPVTMVGLYTERARLTGSYDDYGRAEDLLARVPASLNTAEGVCLARAGLDYALHRLTLAKQTLDGCPSLAGKVEDLSMRANIAFYKGRYKDAGIIYRTLVNQVGSPQTYIQLALYSAKTGAPAEALAYLEAAEKRYHGGSAMMLSWLALQRGLIELDRGRFEEARALFTLADERLPGYWLNEEHLAEVAMLNGETAAAKKVYESVIRRTGAPEYLDSLGSIEAQAGNAQAAKALFDRAEAIYTERAKRFPEAIAGHALAHYIKAEPQPVKALALAEANFKNRPYGDAAIALAKAQLLNARPQAAARLLRQQLTEGWDTAETYWILSLAAKGTGDTKAAAAAAAEALRRNPNSAAQYAFIF